jgi:hypothetical protein
MLYELVMRLSMSSRSLVSLPKISIRSAKVSIKDEKTMQQVHEDMENGNVDLELTF